MKIKLAFYKAKGNLLDKLIRWWTKSHYSHVEIIINDQWISSSAAYDGVDIHDLHELNHEDYSYIDVEVDETRLEEVMEFIERVKDFKYDTFGVILSQVFNLNFHNRNKFFCSEIVIEIMKIFRDQRVIFENPLDFSPGDVFRLYKYNLEIK